jgi:hypothetical protein
VNDSDRPIEALVAEFSAIRAEIGYRSTTQHLLVNLNMIAIGAIIGFALRTPGAPLLLLLVAVVSPTLGLLWADHARSVQYLARYIDRDLHIVRDGQKVKLFLWEEKSSSLVAKQPLYTRFELMRFLIFVVPPLSALLYLVIERHIVFDRSLDTLGWFLGGALTAYMASVLLTTKLKPPADGGPEREQRRNVLSMFLHRLGRLVGHRPRA